MTEVVQQNDEELDGELAMESRPYVAYATSGPSGLMYEVYPSNGGPRIAHASTSKGLRIVFEQMGLNRREVDVPNGEKVVSISTEIADSVTRTFNKREIRAFNKGN